MAAPLASSDDGGKPRRLPPRALNALFAADTARERLSRALGRDADRVSRRIAAGALRTPDPHAVLIEVRLRSQSLASIRSALDLGLRSWEQGGSIRGLVQLALLYAEHAGAYARLIEFVTSGRDERRRLH